MVEYMADALSRADDIAIIAHTSPDGDTLGSALALYAALCSMGKRVTPVCDCAVPRMYQFLPFWEAMRLPKDVHAVTAVAVDCADYGRLGECATLFEQAEVTFNIDHHVTNTRFAQHNAVFEASATGECVLDLIYALRVKPDKDIATCLYTAISTDTGHFSYGNTTGDCLRAAARLIELGVEVMTVTARLYRTRTLSYTRLIGRLIGAMQMLEGGKAAISCLTRADFAACGALEEETEGLIDYLRSIEGVEIVCLLRESSDGIRVSLRSLRDIDVSKIAQRYGGGGHRRAAGCTLDMPLAEAQAAIRADIASVLNNR